MTVPYKNFNVRQLQAYASLCLWKFCNHLNVKHNSINELVRHLISILIANNLPEWEQRGVAIAITGRGDPLPQDVEKIIPVESVEIFNSLVESCVEVGIVDMYGASTNKPYEFVGHCVMLLKQSGIDIPSTDILEKYGRGNDVWGAPINDSEFSDILEIYGVNFS